MPEPVFNDPPWRDRVRFDPVRGFAYVPNSAIVRDSGLDDEVFEGVLAEGESAVFVDDPSKLFRAVRGSFDAIRVVAHLRARGINAQPDHVFFAHDTPWCCCGPHPAMLLDPTLAADPLHANPLHANPLHANPLHANPLHANGPTRSSARPADPPSWYTPSAAQGEAGGSVPPPPQVIVLDTGLAASADLPDFLGHAPVTKLAPGDADVPDSNNDQWLDPAAGHGTFIAGIIERIAPGCVVQVRKVLQAQGEGKESDVADAINDIANGPHPPAFLNLSFGGYVWEQAAMLEDAVLRAQQQGIVVVASAGNDGTCRPSYPAAIPGVVSVGAVGPDGPAWFSNYGSWVRACAPGVDVVSSFFANFDGLEPPSGGSDNDCFRSWATWSGTSFSTPVVVGALVREMRVSNCSATKAVENIIDAPWLGKIPGLGTVVNV